MKRLLLLFPIWLCVVSCDGQKLTRDKAKELLIPATKVPYDVTDVVHNRYVIKADCLIYPLYRYQGYGEAPVDAYNNKGVITLTRMVRATNTCTVDGMDIAVTDEGKKHVVSYDEKEKDYTVRLCKMDFGEVTGIMMQDDNHARVEYTLVRTDVTPFGECYVGPNYQSKIPTERTRSASLVKYDNGWRVETITGD